MDSQTNQLAFDILKELGVASVLAKLHGGGTEKYVEDYLRYFDTVREAIKGEPSKARTFQGPRMQ